MKLKLGIVGPSGCGKTFVANILSAEGESGGVKPPYRPTHSVRIVEFSVPSLPLNKYSVDVDVQLWEIGGNPALKAIYPGVQYGVDGVIIMYDVSKDAHVRDASAYFMQFVTHAPSALSPAAAFVLGNKFRGAAEVGTGRIVGVPPRLHHVALNIEDDSQRLREEVKALLSRVAAINLEQEKANLIN